MDTPASRRFDELYEGDPPWVIGEVQPAVHELLTRGTLQGRVLDVGCGTGENARAMAAAGCDVVAVDVSPRAVQRARAADSGPTEYKVVDATDAVAMAKLGPFDHVVDAGVFHVFDDAARARYVAALAATLRPGGTAHVIVFRDDEPTDWGGPRRVSRAELEAAFGGWDVAIRAAGYRTRFHGPEGGKAWLCQATR